MDLIVSPASAVQDGIGQAFPYLLLVVFIVVTGYYQQAQLTKRREKSGQPQTEQTAQQRQMQTFTKVLPVVFGFISYSLLAGVDLYIAAGQVVRIGQQALIFKLDEGKGGPSDNGAENSSPPPDTEPPATEERRSYQGSKKKQQQRRRKRS